MTTEEKIRKLLDLAGSPNENEAKLAMERARELMAKYCITLSDTPETKPQVTTQFYDPPIRLNNANFKYASLIAHYLSKHFGVYVLICGPKLKLYGFPKNIELACYAFDTIFNQLNAAFKVGYSKERSVTFSEAFWYGAQEGIRKKFDLSQAACEALVVYDPVRAEIEKLKVGSYNARFDPASVNGQRQGEIAGKEATFYQGIQTATQKGHLLQ